MGFVQVESYVEPTADATSKFTAWLDANDISSSASSDSSAENRYSLNIPVSKANEIFDTTFTTFKSTLSDVKTIQALQYSVPANLDSVIEVAHPTTSFSEPDPITPKLSSMNRRLTEREVKSGDSPTSEVVPASCDDSVTPACLQALYGIPTTPATQITNTIDVSGFLNEYAQQSDLTVSNISKPYQQ